MPPQEHKALPVIHVEHFVQIHKRALGVAFGLGIGPGGGIHW